MIDQIYYSHDMPQGTATNKFEGNRQPISELQEQLKTLSQENERLKTALIQSVAVIKALHNVGASRFKSKEVVEEIWVTYYEHEHAPELKIIREILNN